MNSHINGYSLALLELAKEEKSQRRFRKDSKLILKSLEEAEGYEALLMSNVLPVETKKKMIKKAFAKEVSPSVLNFLMLTLDRNKFNVVTPALKKLVKFINQEEKITEGIAYTSVKLTLKELKNIERKAEKLLNKEITLSNKLDAEIVSGFRIVVGDEIIEDTISSRLEDVRNQLLRKDN